MIVSNCYEPTGRVLVALRALVRHFPRVELLLTYLDSSELVPDSPVSQYLTRALPQIVQLPFGVCVRSDLVPKLLGCNDIFAGFDEVYVWPEGHVVQSPPTGIYINTTRRATDWEEYELTVISNWMLQSGCIAALGDGTGLGLNIFSSVPGLAQSIAVGTDTRAG